MSRTTKRKYVGKIVTLTTCLLAFAAGCESADSRVSLTDQLQTLSQEKSELTVRIEQLEAQNRQLQKQVQTLSGLPEAQRGESLYPLGSVKIGRYTNLYDKDGDGSKEKLIVYIQPIDEQGDVVKTAGGVDVQLWNLNNQADKALLGQWRVEQEELKKLWFATMITINYRLTFDVAGIVESFTEPLTVKVAFTDHLSGRVFEAQKVIKPD
jgi:outer membrane murein-binding lipoprotein Lpp